MQTSNDKKKPEYIKKASSVVYWFLRIFFKPALYLLYRFKFDYKSSKGIKRPCVILCNHQTVFDQFAVGVGFNFGVNFIATDTIFRHGLLSWLMRVIARPIPFSRGSPDFLALKNMMHVVKNGGSIVMFPSGNRSFFGDECTILPGIGKLVKKFNVPLVLMQLRGGFNTLPRWKVKPCKGKMTGVVTRVIQNDELTSMTNIEIDDVIQKEICFNEFEYNKTKQIIYRGKRKAEYLESVLFYCPQCNSLTGLCSLGNEFFCKDCGMKVCLNETGFFQKINNAEKIPDTILEWGRKQLEYVKAFDFSGFHNNPVFCDNNIMLFEAERAKKETLLGNGDIKLFADKMTICGRDFLLTETTMLVQGVRKFTIYNNDNVYAVTAPFRTNFVKYMICGYKIRNNYFNSEDETYGY